MYFSKQGMHPLNKASASRSEFKLMLINGLKNTSPYYSVKKAMKSGKWFAKKGEAEKTGGEAVPSSSSSF